MKGFMYKKSKWRFLSRLSYNLRQVVKVSPGFFNRIVKYGVFQLDLCPTFFKRASFVYADGDFVRNSMLELASREIEQNGISGAVAELGVFRGEYSKLINRAFSDRKLYLFDTFDGFDAKEEDLDQEKGYSSTVDDFSDTSVELVLRKMKYPQNCIVKKGFFPDTAIGLDDNFAFVSIDCDLYKPIFAGLVFFYERLSCGGFIFVHDYQNRVYGGANAAVRDFCKQYRVYCVPMADTNGSAIITKTGGAQ